MSTEERGDLSRILKVNAVNGIFCIFFKNLDCLFRKVASKGDGQQELVDGASPVKITLDRIPMPLHLSTFSTIFFQDSIEFPPNEKLPIPRHNVNLSMPRHKANESLRPGKPRSHADIFGIEGSFRRLRSTLDIIITDAHSYRTNSGD